jgi:hypothetical protein
MTKKKKPKKKIKFLVRYEGRSWLTCDGQWFEFETVDQVRTFLREAGAPKSTRIYEVGRKVDYKLIVDGK